MLTFLKHLGFLAFPTTRGFSFSAVELQASKMVILTLEIFQSLHLSPANVLFGTAR